MTLQAVRKVPFGTALVVALIGQHNASSSCVLTESDIVKIDEIVSPRLIEAETLRESMDRILDAQALLSDLFHSIANNTVEFSSEECSLLVQLVIIRNFFERYTSSGALYGDFGGLTGLIWKYYILIDVEIISPFERQWVSKYGEGRAMDIVHLLKYTLYSTQWISSLLEHISSSTKDYTTDSYVLSMEGFNHEFSKDLVDAWALVLAERFGSDWPISGPVYSLENGSFLQFRINCVNAGLIFLAQGHSASILLPHDKTRFQCGRLFVSLAQRNEGSDNRWVYEFVNATGLNRFIDQLSTSLEAEVNNPESPHSHCLSKRTMVRICTKARAVL